MPLRNYSLTHSLLLSCPLDGSVCRQVVMAVLALPFLYVVCYVPAPAGQEVSDFRAKVIARLVGLEAVFTLQD